MAIFSADLETTTDAYSKEETKVWAGAFCDITQYDNDTQVHFFSTISEFISLFDTYFLDGDIIYFHNLKFDGSFLMNGLFDEGFIHVDDAKQDSTVKCFSTLISDLGTWYSITIRNHNKIIEIRNSLCLIAGSVASIGDSFKTRKRKLEIDYTRNGDFDAPMTAQEREYLMADVQIIAEALNTLINEYNFKRLTAGANALNDFIEKFGSKKKFRKYFPELSQDEDEFVRNSYKGGFCYLKPGYTGKFLGEGTTYDVNSLYPSMMHSMSGNLYPYQKGRYFRGRPPADDDFPLWVARISIYATRKLDKLPCVQIKKSFRFKENDWLDIIGYEDGPVEITITSVDWELIQECYDIDQISWIEGYCYQARLGLFDKFIDYWYEIKRNSTGAKKQVAKLVLNSFYGKFGTKLHGRSKIPYQSDGTLKFNTSEEEEHKGIYIPVATFVTAYARRFTITAGNANYDRAVYFDTDSIHLLGHDEALGIKVDDSDLCAWKKELEWDNAKFLRQKTYMEKAGNKLDIKCAGMPNDMKYEKYLGEDGKVHKFPRIGFDDFYIGARWETGKLVARQVKGGVLLLDTPFEIRDVIK